MTTEKPITLHVSSGADGDAREIDLTETVQISDGTGIAVETTKLVILKTLYGYSDGYDIHGDVLLAEYGYFANANEARKNAGNFYTYINKGKVKQEAIAKAQEKVDSTLADLTAAVLDADTDRILAINDELTKAKKALTKAQTGRSGNDNGDRSNPLPAFESTNAVLRGKNGDRVLAIRGDAIDDYEKHGLSANWQAFQSDGNGNYAWAGTLGEQTSWSSLNQAISTEVLGLDGKSIGTNGLSKITAENLETIRTTMLVGLPDKQ